MATGLETVSFLSIPKKGNAKECSNYHTLLSFHMQSKAQNSPSQASAVCEPRTSKCSRWIQKRQKNQRSSCQHLLDHRKSKRIHQNLSFCFIDYAKAFHCVSLVQFRSVAQSCLTLCNPVNHSMPGLPVPHQLLEFTQTHVHRVSDAIQPSHLLSSPSPPAPNPSQHQSLFQ